MSVTGQSVSQAGRPVRPADRPAVCKAGNESGSESVSQSVTGQVVSHRSGSQAVSSKR